MIGRLASSWGLFLGAMSLGWWLGQRGMLSEARANRLLRFAVKWLSPVVLCLSFWSLEVGGRGLAWVPIIGALACLAALGPSWLYARRARLSKPQTGSFLTCAMFSNVGYIGAFVAFALAGESGYGVGVWYLVYFTPCFYLIGMTIAKRFGSQTPDAASTSPFSEELRLFPFAGMLLGSLLHLTHCPRPEVLGWVNHVLIPIDTAIHLTAVGSQIHVGPFTGFWKPALAMSAIKFFYTPLVSWALASATRLEGLPRFVVLLQGAMPVAVSPLLLAVVFRLDRRFSSALWFVTNLLAIPWLFLYLPLIRP